MKGYVAFVLVFISTLLLLSLLELNKTTADYSQAIAAERSEILMEDVKHAVIETGRRGAVNGFSTYEASHDIKYCRHCPDYACSVALIGNNNICDMALCKLCFRDDEARISAEKESTIAIGRFWLDFDSLIKDKPELAGIVIEAEHKEAVIAVIISPEVNSKNGFVLSMVRFEKEVRIVLESVQYGIRATGKIPAGFVVDARPGNN